jgi:hypothetical protein
MHRGSGFRPRHIDFAPLRWGVFLLHRSSEPARVQTATVGSIIVGSSSPLRLLFIRFDTGHSRNAVAVAARRVSALIDPSSHASMSAAPSISEFATRRIAGSRKSDGAGPRCELPWSRRLGRPERYSELRIPRQGSIAALSRLCFNLKGIPGGITYEHD